MRGLPFGLLLVLPAALYAGTADGDGATGLLEKVRAQHQARTVVSDIRVEIVRPDWNRVLELRVIEDQDRRRYRSEVLRPRKLRGTLYLRAGHRLWMYMPKLRRRVSISPAMLLEPWMGSDLTNQDLLQADAVIDDYDHRIADRRPSGDTEVVTIESRPKASAPVVWGHLRQKIRSDGVPLEMTYFDHHGQAVRRIEFSAIRVFGDHRLPTLWRIIPLPEDGRHTELRVTAMEFNVSLPDDAFVEIPATESR